MNAFVRSFDPFPDVLGFGTGVQQNSDYHRGVENEQRQLSQVSRVVSIPHSTDRYLRRFI